MNTAVQSRGASVISVEDVQSRADTRRIPINRVGIKDIRHPVKVKDRSAGEQHTVATFNMYVNLPHNFKGTHMSRFVEILHLLLGTVHGHVGLQRQIRQVESDYVDAIENNAIPELLRVGPGLRHGEHGEAHGSGGRCGCRCHPRPRAGALIESCIQQLTAMREIGLPLWIESGELASHPAVFMIRFHIV